MVETFDELAGRLSRVLGAADLATLDVAVEECLAALGTFAGVDVAFAVLVDDDERVADDWRWVAGDRDLEAPAPGSPLRDTFGSATEFLRIGHTVAVDDLSTLPLAPSERALADRNGLRAIVVAPVRVGHTLLGLTGLQVLDEPRHWRRTDVEQLELLAQVLVQAVVRTRERGALAAADARARRIAEFIPDGLLLLDLDGRVNFASPSFLRAVGATAAELQGTPFADLVHGGDVDPGVLTGTASSSGVVARVRGRGGAWRWTELSWQRAEEPGVPDEIVVIARDVHDRLDLDPLTGALNRAGLERGVADLGAEPVLVAFADVDRFKVVNDIHGHDAGDGVLRATAAALRGATRDGDLVARVGGDEFCVVARAAADADPQAFAGRLAIALGALAHGEPSVTVSVGVAGPGPASDFAELRRRADGEMYRAKRSSR